MVQEHQSRCRAKGHKLSPTQTWVGRSMVYLWSEEGRSWSEGTRGPRPPTSTSHRHAFCDWSNYAGNITTMSSLLGNQATVLLLSAGEGELQNYIVSRCINYINLPSIISLLSPLQPFTLTIPTLTIPTLTNTLT